MDTSEIYIRMCGAAEEIQSLRTTCSRSSEPKRENYTWEEGDYFFAEGYSKDVYLCGGDCNWPDRRLLWGDGEVIGSVMEIDSAGYCEGDGEDVVSIIWLPRQDQLLAMAGYNGAPGARNIVSWLVELTHFAMNCEAAWITGGSWEQLLLCFVMREKYGKVRDGEQWVKSS